VTACQSLDDVLAAADADSAGDPPLSQDTADLVAALLAPHRTQDVSAA
jgi:hypothetical protein